MTAKKFPFTTLADAWADYLHTATHRAGDVPDATVYLMRNCFYSGALTVMRLLESQRTTESMSELLNRICDELDRYGDTIGHGPTTQPEEGADEEDPGRVLARRSRRAGAKAADAAKRR